MHDSATLHSDFMENKAIAHGIAQLKCLILMDKKPHNNVDCAWHGILSIRLLLCVTASSQHYITYL